MDLLAESFAQDQMTMEEFERRVGLVQGAESMRELKEALGNPAGTGGSRPPPSLPLDNSALPLDNSPRPVPPARIRESDRSLAIFGETKRTGRWMPARSTQVVSVLGSAVIDLREATLLAGEYALTAWCVLGSVEVIVPPGVAIECRGSAVMGSFEQLGSASSDMPVGAGTATVVRLDGLSVLGSVEVAVRYAGESKREARRRRRIEKKERRKLAR